MDKKNISNKKEIKYWVNLKSYLRESDSETYKKLRKVFSKEKFKSLVINKE